MKREFTCIICPNGCEIQAEINDGVLTSVSGHTCPKGEAYVRQELTDPRRNIATSVLVKDPKDQIFAAMETIRGLSLTAPVKAGDVILKGILGNDSDVIVTKSVLKIS